MKQLNYIIIYIFSLVPLTIFAERHYVNMKITAVIPERISKDNINNKINTQKVTAKSIATLNQSGKRP